VDERLLCRFGVTGSFVEIGQRGSCIGCHVRQAEIASHVERFARPTDGVVVADAVCVGAGVHRHDLCPQRARWFM
jgi:hypothetical protein